MAAGLVRDGELVWSGAAGTVRRSDGEPPRRHAVPHRLDHQDLRGASWCCACATRAGWTCRPARRPPARAPRRRAVTIAQLLSHTAGLRAETPRPVVGAHRRAATGPTSLDELGRRAGFASRPAAGSTTPTSASPCSASSSAGSAAGRGTRSSSAEHPRPARHGADDSDARSRRSAPGWPCTRGPTCVLPEPEHDAGAMAPAGQLWSTVDDLARWAAFLARRRRPGLLSADTLAEMCEPIVVNDIPGEAWTVRLRARPAVVERRGPPLRRHGGSMPGFLAGSGRPRDGRRAGRGRLRERHVRPGHRRRRRGPGHDRRPGRAADPGAWTPLPAADPDLLALAGPWYWGANPFALSCWPTVSSSWSSSGTGAGSHGSPPSRTGPGSGWTATTAARR